MATAAQLLTILPSSPVASYYVVVTNGCGAMTQSAAATLTLAACNAPAITQQPSSVSIAAGTTTTLMVGASGDAPLAFQWFESSNGATWTALANQTSASLTVTPAATSYYYVHVSNGCGSADSNFATVTVVPSGCTPPSIQTQPQNISMQQSAPVTLSVVASGTGLTYQWYQSTSSTSGWTPVANGTSSSVTLTAAYSPAYFYVQIKGTCGSLNSNIVTVRTLWLECPPPMILTPPPQPITYDFGSSVTLTLSATGSDLRYVWFVSDPAGSPDTVMQNGPSNTFTYTPQTDGEVFVRARVFNDACGSYADSDLWTLYASNYCPVPDITTQPQSATIAAGGSATLSVAVSSACQGQVTYQWYQADPGFGWLPIAGATSPSITVSPTQSEFYEVQVTNTQGTTVASNSAFVTVQ